MDNMQVSLEPVYRKIADREVNSIIKSLSKDIALGLTEIGPLKRCEDVVKENLKDFKGIVKAVGYDSPNPKFKTILGLNGVKYTAVPGNQMSSQV